jgi:hypothetical protein
MKFNQYRNEKASKLLGIIRYSILRIPQITNAIKTFIFSRLDYITMSNIVSKTEHGKEDNSGRNIINEVIGGLPLSKDTFYISWEYGG